ncbi:divalent metal cation transporter, partial [bacterium]|nr:divalent metal cation transporter [bacterium]
YRYLEKMMTFFLIFMFLAFLINLVMAEPDMAAAARGAVVPTIPDVENTTELFVTLCGLVATTFVIVCAFFQSYTVKAKGWHDADLASGITDTVLASVMFTLVGTVIMMTAASVLHPKFVSGEIDQSVTVSFPMMISQLETAFPGGMAKVIFGVGFWAAAFSSFVTNSCIGGVLLNDGLGLGGRINSTSTKVCATVALLVGLATCLMIISGDSGGPGSGLKVQAIAIGQACTMLAVPLGAIATIIVLFDSKAVKGRGLGVFGKAFVLFGTAVLLGVAALMVVHLGRTFGLLSSG